MRKATVFLLLSIYLFTAAGCWDRVEIEDRRFVTAIGIDKRGDEKIGLTLAFPKIAKDKDSAGESEIKAASGATLTDAIKSLEKETGKTIYIGQAKMIVIGGGVLQDAGLLKRVMDECDAHPDLDRRVYVFASEENAAGSIKAKDIDALLARLKKDGDYFKQGFDKLYTALNKTGRGAIPAADLSGASVIKDYRGAGALNSNELRGILWAKAGACKNASLTIEEGGGPVRLAVKKHRARMYFAEDGGRLTCVIDVKITGEINNGNSADIGKLQSAFAGIIENEITRSAAKAQYELCADGFGWLDALRKSRRGVYAKYERDWGHVFPGMEIVPRVTVRII